ncbi:MAG: hypothetical protein HRF50_15960 [Phycisphaerae bacterium]|jgi:hypothetical protein
MTIERIGLAFDEFADLKLRPHAGADWVFHEAAEMERREMFPMALIVASNHLRSRGYDCRLALLEALAKNGVVTPAAPDAWSQADVDVAARGALAGRWSGGGPGHAHPGRIMSPGASRPAAEHGLWFESSASST